MKWKFIVKRYLSVLFLEFICKGQSKKGMKRELGLDSGYDNYRCIEGDVSYTEEDLYDFNKMVKSRFDKEKYRFFVSLLNKMNKLKESLMGAALEVSKKDFSKFSDKELFDEFTKLAEKYFKFSVSLMVPLTIEKIADDVIKVDLKDKVKDVNEYFGILTTPERKTADAEELNSILNIAVKIQDGKIKLDNNDEKLVKEIKEHIKRFGWINTRGFYGNEWTVGEIFERLKDMLNEDCKKRLNELNKKHSYIRSKTDEILKEINADKDFRKLVDITKEYVAYRTDRMDAFVKSGFIARPLFKELTKRMKLELDDFFNLTVEEIEDILLHGRDYSEEISRRRKKFGFIFYKDSVRVLTGKELEEYIQKEGKEDIKEVKELRGTVANKGLATGVIKVLFKKADMVKVKKGDILVISMTTPDFVPAMERAAAFVTDEGGILCHAAIVSREMNKPCIIGTKYATKIFKDGDLVEVDAEKGIVKIIRK